MGKLRQEAGTLLVDLVFSSDQSRMGTRRSHGTLSLYSAAAQSRALPLGKEGQHGGTDAREHLAVPQGIQQERL